MKYYYRDKKGSVLVYVLVFYLLFTSWFLLSLTKTVDYLNDLSYLKKINRNLELEKEALKYLKQHLPTVPPPLVKSKYRVDFVCTDDICDILITGDINYAFKYVIIK